MKQHLVYVRVENKDWHPGEQGAWVKSFVVTVPNDRIVKQFYYTEKEFLEDFWFEGL